MSQSNHEYFAKIFDLNVDENGNYSLKSLAGLLDDCYFQSFNIQFKFPD